MPTYIFKCDSSHITRVEGSMSEPPLADSIRCSICNEKVYRDFSGISLAIFKPFVDTNITGEPIEIGSRQKLEEVLNENSMFADSRTYVKPKPDGEIKLDDKLINEIINYEEANREAIKKEIKEMPKDPGLPENTTIVNV